MTYNSKQVAHIAGISLRQLQWWDERKVVSPRHEGHRRVYFTVETIEICVIAELRRKGFSLQKIRRILRFMQKEVGRRLTEAMADSSDLHLITDGESIYLEDHQDHIINILKNAKQPMFLVCVTDQAEKMGWQRTAQTSTGPLVEHKPASPASTLRGEQNTSLTRLQRKFVSMNT